MKKLVLLGLTATIILLSQTETKAQQTYKNALGGRLGFANGITFKTFVAPNKALDFILNFQSKEDVNTFRFTGLYEIHNPINNAAGLKWYYGIGGTLGSYKYKYADNGELYASLDGVLGLDYKFNGAPINMSLDWKPAFEVAPNSGFDSEGFGLSIRFTF